jgi:exopolyphosphatase/guanosine-5'-triphosphate,3'-diphosphate pyrophosphatase
MLKDRADIIVAGSLILYEVMKACSIREIRVTEFGLRYGMLMDYLSRSPGSLPEGDLSVRDMSIHRLSQMFGVDQEHAEHISDLVSQMFDSARAAGFFSYDDRWRELLLYAAHVHDVGQFISFYRHQLHSAYIVSNAEIVGFSEYEILIISLFCRYHRKRFPREKDPGYDTLSVKDKRAVFVLSFILRWAEILDRSHDGRVRTVVLTRAGDHKILLTLTAVRACTLEMWAVEDEIPLFKNVFDYDVTIACTKEK